MGPVNNAKQLKTVTDMIGQARASGAEVRECGRVSDEVLYRRGYFQKPALVFNPDQSLDIVAEEQFGPALPIMPFDFETEAIRRANDSRYGLCSSVWTEDRDRALTISRQLEAGYTYLTTTDPQRRISEAPSAVSRTAALAATSAMKVLSSFRDIIRFRACLPGCSDWAALHVSFGGPLRRHLCMNR